jgi:hypothetical protein
MHFKAVFCRTLLILVAALFLAGCPLQDDDLEGSGGLAPRLYGVWRFEYGRIVEEISNPGTPATTWAP